MMTTVTTMLTCHWAGRRIQRYLDADASAPLEPAEVRRLDAHLATCAKCSAAAQEYRGLARAMASWSLRRAPDPAMTARIRLACDALLAEDKA